jgi:hypothetical protein
MEPNSEIWGQIRHLLTLIAGGLVTKGYFDSSYVEPIIGLSMAALVTVWSWWSKRQAKKLESQKIALAVSMPSSATVKAVEKKFEEIKEKEKEVPK